MRPGDWGTRKLVKRYGERLDRARYRYDVGATRRYKTVELIVGETAWVPCDRSPRANRSPEEMVCMRVTFGEEGLRAIWQLQNKVWKLPWGVVRRLGFEDWVVAEQPRGIQICVPRFANISAEVSFYDWEQAFAGIRFLGQRFGR